MSSFQQTTSNVIPAGNKTIIKVDHEYAGAASVLRIGRSGKREAALVHETEMNHAVIESK
jgi:hypothetical protein